MGAGAGRELGGEEVKRGLNGRFCFDPVNPVFLMYTHKGYAIVVMTWARTCDGGNTGGDGLASSVKIKWVLGGVKARKHDIPRAFTTAFAPAGAHSKPSEPDM